MLTYLLVLRLLDGETNHFYKRYPRSRSCFAIAGIFSFDPSRWTGPDGIGEPCKQLGLTLNREDGLLLLLDSDVAHISPPIRGGQIFVVQATSRMPFTAAWIEEFGAIRRFLKPWSWPEIAIWCVNHFQNANISPSNPYHDGSNLFQTSPVEVIPLREVFDVLPASPRVCYGLGNAKMLKTKLSGIRSACSGFIIGRESRMVEGEWLKNMITCLWPNDGQRSDFHTSSPPIVSLEFSARPRSLGSTQRQERSLYVSHLSRSRSLQRFSSGTSPIKGSTTIRFLASSSVYDLQGLVGEFTIEFGNPTFYSTCRFGSLWFNCGIVPAEFWPRNRYPGDILSTRRHQAPCSGRSFF